MHGARVCDVVVLVLSGGECGDEGKWRRRERREDKGVILGEV